MRRVARRYAKALLKIGQEDGSLERYGEELALFNNYMQAEEKLRAALVNPTIHSSQREAVIRELAPRLGLSEVMVRFLVLLVERNRMDVLPEIVEVYRELLDDAMGRVRGVLYVPFELPEEKLQEIVKGLEEKVGKKVILRVELDPSIIGGAVAKIGGVVYDGSVKAQLRRLRENLAKG